MSEVKLDKTMLVHIRPEETIIPDIKSLQIDNALEQNRLNFEAKKEEIYRNKLQGQQQELERYKNIIDELERYIKDELILDFYNDDMPCELIVNKMLKQIKELKGE